MPTTPPPQVERKQGRDTTWVFIEILCAFLVVSGVNMKLSDDRAKEYLDYYNKVFEYQVEIKWEDKEWVDQHDVAEDKKTPAQSIQERVHHIKTDTQETVISSIHDTITKLVRNVWLSHLKNKNGGTSERFLKGYFEKPGPKNTWLRISLTVFFRVFFSRGFAFFEGKKK
jgi:hypothetical protein